MSRRASNHRFRHRLRSRSQRITEEICEEEKHIVPLIALIDNHSKDAAQFGVAPCFHFNFYPLGARTDPRQRPDGARCRSFSLSLSFFLSHCLSLFLSVCLPVCMSTCSSRPARLFMPPSFLRSSSSSSATFYSVIARADYKRSL